MLNEPVNESGKKIPGYWWIESVVGGSFNRLKAKCFNLIEASVVDKSQQEALKGLIKGFANDEYQSCLEDMRYEAKQAKIIDEKADSIIPPIGVYSLENQIEA